MPSLFQRLTDRLFGPEIRRRVALAVRAVDDITDRQIRGQRNTEGWRDRYDYDREQVLRDALQAWRVNPLARRIVSLTSQYVVGAGVKIEADDERLHDFLKAWWSHRLNRMDVRAIEWCDELTRSGELFIVLSTDPGGMSYVRAVPAHDIQEIIVADNDPEQALAFREKPTPEGGALDEGRLWKAYDPNNDQPTPNPKLQTSNGSEPVGSLQFELGTLNFEPVMFHYAINRPAGAKHGESDLAPLLRWLARYATWIEDRARLNHWRQVFLYIVTGKYPDEAAKSRRQMELNANPPTPGSILVADESETWDVIAPKLDAFEAGQDGLTLKKLIASGAAIPIHFLAEPESATRTTAESAGGPTFRHYQQRQIFFLWLLHDLALAAAARHARATGAPAPKPELIHVTGADISAKDNAALAAAAVRIISSFGALYDRGLVDEEELLRLSYTFAGEVVDVQKLLKRVVPPRVQPRPFGGAAGTDAPGSEDLGDAEARPAAFQSDPVDPLLRDLRPHGEPGDEGAR